MSDETHLPHPPRLPLGTPVALRRATGRVPTGMIGQVVGYYADEAGEVQYAVSFEPIDSLLRLPRQLLEADLGL